MTDESKTEENVTTEANTEILEELQKIFPQSKESSISFPNIDKVNKKLSDLFDYIGKYTMEESEETKELEKRQIEAEIELAKAETKQAIRESERNFGSVSNIQKADIVETGQIRKKNKFGSGTNDSENQIKELEQQIKRLNDQIKDFKNMYESKLTVNFDIKDLNNELKKIKNVEERKENLETFNNFLTKIKQSIKDKCSTDVDDYNTNKLNDLKNCNTVPNNLDQIKKIEDKYIKAISLFSLENKEDIIREAIDNKKLKLKLEDLDVTNKTIEELISDTLSQKINTTENQKFLSELIQEKEKQWTQEKEKLLSDGSDKIKATNYIESWGFTTEKPYNAKEVKKKMEDSLTDLFPNDTDENVTAFKKKLNKTNLSIETDYKNFIATHEEYLKIKFAANPVRNVINFSTFIKLPGKEKPQEIYGEELEVEGFKKQDNFLKQPKDGISEKDTIESILGKYTQLIVIKKDNAEIKLGPYYQLLHTSNENKDKKEYNVEQDLSRLIDKKFNLDHITYAGYGFSGSGKTYTLIESDNSIVSQVSKYLNKKSIKFELNVHEWYDERYDSGCMGKIPWNGFNSQSIELPHKKPNDYDNKPIVEKIKYINKERKTHQLGPNTNEIYRTSIRRTTFNDQSSRSHMFIDFVLPGGKKITVLDMAGAEDANVIQNDYFETLQKIELENFDEKSIEKNFGKIQKDVENLTFSTISNFNKLMKGLIKEFKGVNIKDSDKNKIFIINPSKWYALFNDIYKGDKEEFDKKQYFIKNFNRYQFCKQIDFIKTLYNSLIKIQQQQNDDEGYRYLTINNINKTISIKTSYGPYKHIKSMKGFKIHDEDFKKSLNDIIIQLQYNQKAKETFQNSLNVGENNKEKLYEFIYNSITKEEGVRYSKDKTTVYKDFVDNMKWFTTSDSYGFFKEYGLEIDNINKIERELDPINSIAIKKSIQSLTGILDGLFWKVKNPKVKNPKKEILSFLVIYKEFIVALDECTSKMKESIEKVQEQFKKKTEELRAIEKDETIKKYLKGDLEFYDTPSKYGEILKDTVFNKTINEFNEIIKKYHCPLRFQGNAINDSIQQFKENLSKLNKNKKIDGGFPYNIDKWKKNELSENPKREFVVFTNIRLDIPKECKAVTNMQKTLCDAFHKSLCFSHGLLHDEIDECKEKKENFGKKISKKTSTRSFRKRGRHRGPSETEIL